MGSEPCAAMKAEKAPTRARASGQQGGEVVPAAAQRGTQPIGKRHADLHTGALRRAPREEACHAEIHTRGPVIGTRDGIAAAPHS